MFIKETRPFKGRFFMVLLFLLFLGNSGARAQKVSERSYDAAELTKLQIDAEQIFEVELKSTLETVIRTRIFIEGEYQSELTVTAKQDGSTLFLKGVFMPSFENPNDKLSAHKVVSVRVVVLVPADIIVEVAGSATRVTAQGAYEDLYIRTGKGPVFLEQPRGLIRVKTLSGEIIARGAEGVLTATSGYGKVVRNKVPKGNSGLSLETVSGDIYINKQE